MSVRPAISMAQNEIARLQNAEPQLQLRKAARVSYDAARSRSVVHFGLAVGLPILGAIATGYWAWLVPWVALYSIAMVIADEVIFAEWVSRAAGTGARISEQFDCEVLSMTWDALEAGERLSAERIRAAEIRCRDASGLADWYAPVVTELPLHLARMVCQRVNLVYDSGLRRSYARFVLLSAGAAAVGLICYAMGMGDTLADDVVRGAPVAPVFGWALREYSRQRSVSARLDEIVRVLESALDGALKEECSVPKCEAISRQVQSAIFRHRSTASSVMPFVYRWLRARSEDRINHGAEHYVARFRANRAARAVDRAG